MTGRGHGSFEQFVESLLIEYIESLGGVVPTFDDLPSVIQGNHAELSARLIVNAGQDKYKDRAVVPDIAQRIASSKAGEAVALNALAYIDHGKNLRFGVLDAMFRAVGVTGLQKHLVSARAMADYWDEKFSGTTLEGLGDGVLFEDLTDLVQRRNTVAHGWSSELSILSPDSLRSLIAFMLALGSGLEEIVWGYLLQHELRHHATKLPAPTQILKAHRVACFEMDEGSIEAGSRLIVVHPGAELPVDATVLELQVDNEAVAQVVAPPKVGFGCRLDIDVSAGCEFHAVASHVDEGTELGTQP